MPDRDEVIKAIEACMNQNHPAYCNECYLDGPGFGIACREKLMRDTLALLREQEPVAPRYKDPDHAYCGACGCRIPLKIKARYCHKCGRAVKWNGC